MTTCERTTNVGRVWNTCGADAVSNQPEIVAVVAQAGTPMWTEALTLIVQLVALLSIAVGVAAVLVVVSGGLDERSQVRKASRSEDVPEYRIVAAREQVCTNIGWPASLAIVTGLFVSMAATYVVEFFQSISFGVQPTKLLPALACLLIAMLVLVAALRWMRADLDRDLSGTGSPEALASAMTALRSGHDELRRRSARLGERLRFWERALPLYAVGRRVAASQDASLDFFSPAAAEALKKHLRNVDWNGRSRTDHQRMRTAGRASLDYSGWEFRCPPDVMWFLPAGALSLALAGGPWGWYVGGVATAGVVWLVWRWYHTVHGQWCARSYAEGAAWLAVAQREWDLWERERVSEAGSITPQQASGPSSSGSSSRPRHAAG